MRKIYAAMALAITTWTTPAISHQDAQDWVSAQILIRQITVEGMEQRIELLKNNASMDDQIAQDATVQKHVVDALRNFDISIVDHLRWKSDNEHEVQSWLSTHIDDETLLRDLETRYQRAQNELTRLTDNQR